MGKKMREFRERCKQNAEYTMGQYLQELRWNNRVELCNNFIDELAKLLGDKYEIIASCNKDLSRYLIPVGTRDKITYYGKPVLSFRISDHWSWFSNLKKCSVRNYIQCYSRDMPVPKARPVGQDCATKPIRGIQVCVQMKDGMYHHVYGEKYDRKTHTWSWVENDPKTVLAALGL